MQEHADKRRSFGVRVVGLPGRKRAHFVAFIEYLYGPYALPWGMLHPIETDPAPGWEADTTVCGRPGPFEYADAFDRGQLCGACLRGSADRAYDAAPPELRERTP